MDLTRKFVVDELPEKCLYIIIPNKHGEAKPLVGDAEVYPEDTLPAGQFLGPLNAAEVVRYLYRNGKVPEWINIYVEAVEGDVTIFKLWCCGHFTSLPSNTYNAMIDPDFEEHTPFAIRSTDHPEGWKSGDAKYELKDTRRFY